MCSNELVADVAERASWFVFTMKRRGILGVREPRGSVPLGCEVSPNDATVHLPQGVCAVQNEPIGFQGRVRRRRSTSSNSCPLPDGDCAAVRGVRSTASVGPDKEELSRGTSARARGCRRLGNVTDRRLRVTLLIGGFGESFLLQQPLPAVLREPCVEVGEPSPLHPGQIGGENPIERVDLIRSIVGVADLREQQ